MPFISLQRCSWCFGSLYTAAMTALSVMSPPRRPGKGARMTAGHASPSTGSRKPDTPRDVAVSIGSPGSAARCSGVRAAQRAAMASKTGPSGWCDLCTYITSVRWLFLWGGQEREQTKRRDTIQQQGERGEKGSRAQ